MKESILNLLDFAYSIENLIATNEHLTRENEVLRKKLAESDRLLNSTYQTSVETQANWIKYALEADKK